MKRSLKENRYKEILEEAIRLRAKGLSLQEVIERTGIPKTMFYRELYRLEMRGGIITQE